MATQPTITERQPRDFELRTVTFNATVMDSINEWLHKQIESLINRNKKLHQKLIPEWRKIVEGEPREEDKSFPFPNCSNLVDQLVGESVDDLVARVLGVMWLTAPLCYFKYPPTKDPEETLRYSDKEKALEDFLDRMACNPFGLNLYPYQNKWFTDAAGLGKGYIGLIPEERIEATYIGYEDNKKRAKFSNDTIYEGPKLINLRYEDILVRDSDIPFEENDPIVKRCTLNKRKLQERAYRGQYDPEKVKEIIGKPDRYGENETKQRENRRKGVSEVQDTTVAEWDIYECYFSWWHNKKKYRLIAWYHQYTKTLLNCVFNYIPKHQIPIIETRLSVDGKGFAQMLKHYQEEVSTAKNQRNDAILYGMLGINTIDPQVRNIDRNFTLWPGVNLPAPKDAFQHYEVASPAMGGLSLQNEEAMRQQARARAGVDPPINAMGAGGLNKKGQFGGSMGTMAVLQGSNSRTAHRTSGFRHSNVRLYSLTTDFYGMMDLGDTDTVKEALDDFLARDLQIPLRASDASMNREVTKQNLIILNQALEAYVQRTSSLIQAYLRPDAGDIHYKKWLRGIIIGRQRMMQETIKEFQVSNNPQEYVPDVELEKPENVVPQQPQGQGGGPGNVLSMAQAVQGRGAGGPPTGQPGMAGALPGLDATLGRTPI